MTLKRPCKNCNIPFLPKGRFSKVCDNCCNKARSRSDWYKCPNCNYRFKFEARLKNHSCERGTNLNSIKSQEV